MALDLADIFESDPESAGLVFRAPCQTILQRGFSTNNWGTAMHPDAVSSNHGDFGAHGTAFHYAYRNSCNANNTWTLVDIPWAFSGYAKTYNLGYGIWGNVHGFGSHGVSGYGDYPNTLHQFGLRNPSIGMFGPKVVDGASSQVGFLGTLDPMRMVMECEQVLVTLAKKAAAR